MRELLFAYLATRPEFARPRSCRAKLVGPMRSYLWQRGGAQTEVVTQFWPDAPPRALALIAERTVASTMLADFCARCGRCDWGDHHDTRPIAGDGSGAGYRSGRNDER